MVLSVTPSPGVDVKADEDIRKDVVSELYWDARLNIPDVSVTVTDGVVTIQGTADSYLEKAAVDTSDIHVTVDEGVVTLSGTVGTLLEMDAALEDAMMTNGVIDVNSNLEVRVFHERSDDAIKQDILEAFRRDGMVPEEDIRVDVENGVVTLDGITDRAIGKFSAEINARLTRGVRGVVNNITVPRD